MHIASSVVVVLVVTVVIAVVVAVIVAVVIVAWMSDGRVRISVIVLLV